MAAWTEEQLQAWFREHAVNGVSRERGRKPVYKSVPILDPKGEPLGGTRQEYVGEELTAQDGATIVIIRRPTSGLPGEADYEVNEHMDPKPDESRLPPVQTPEQTRANAANAAQQEIETRTATLEEAEKQYNANPANPGASGFYETHAQKAKRLADQAQEARAAQAAEDKRKEDARRAEIDAATNKRGERALDIQEREGAATRAISAASLEEQIRAARARENKPEILSRADRDNPYIVSSGPQGISQVANPNYDATKAAAEEKRAELASQIASRRMTLDEAQASYTQWFDTNVKIPMMQAQEARARAEERRQALEAEERRRQFAADYKLRKAQLGETAASRATQAEISLLPYRAGKNYGAEMSSAINSLAAGGKVSGPDAGAGIKFSPDSFSFNRPDFQSIAKQAMKDAIGHLTDYRPSDDQFETGDYSGIPGISGAGAPALPPVGGGYQYSPLPPPSPGADQPVQ